MATNRIPNYIRDGKNFSFTENRIKNLFDNGLEYHPHVEPRIRKDDLTQALSMKVYDPLWMLSRQWQMGEFRGNNAGTAVSVKCLVKQEDCSTDPIEPITEQVNPAIDLMVRVESAMHYIEMIKGKFTPSDFQLHKKELCEKYPIKWEDADSHILDCNATKGAEDKLNAQRIRFIKAFQNKAFDGYKLYIELNKKQYNNDPIARVYVNWFNKQYLPAGNNGSSNSHWHEQSLNYTIDITAGSRHFIGDRYQGGRLSWYTVDDDGSINNIEKPTFVNIASLPTLAHYPGAPNKRLWQFEDHAVFMGNSTEQQTKANEMFLKFATLYSNDWMLIPLKTAIGKHITVKYIKVIDTFGILHTIKRRAGVKDTVDNSQENWQMYTNSKYGTFDGSAEDGLFYAPQLAATLESKPIEEVELLRDEMANMVWGVEKTVSDGCGSTLDEQLKAVQLKTFIDDLYEQNRIKPEPGIVSFSENKEVRVLVICNPDMVQKALDAGADYAGLDKYIQKIKEGWTDFDVLITTPNIMPKIGALGRILNPLGLMPTPKAGTVTTDIVKAVQEVKANKIERKNPAQSDYRYTLQTHVPFNWIPFVPQHVKDDKDKSGNHFDLWGREMILRRGKMPCHILTDKGYERYAVLPVTSILRKGLDGNYQPLFINEEEVQQTGIRLIKNYQRTRWLNGKTYLWLGMYKRLAKFSEKSGLEFDTLHEK